MALNIDDFREHTSKILDDLGLSIIVAQKTVATTGMGFEQTVTSTTLGTYIGDLQVITESDEELLKQGIAEKGDARIFLPYSAAIDSYNIRELTFTVGGVPWTGVKLLAAEKVGSNVDYYEIIARKDR